LKLKATSSPVLSEYLRLLHPPTTSCILAFAMIGSITAPVIYWDRLLWILLEVFLAGGVAANYFDEIKGRPWHTRIPETHLWMIGSSSLSTSSLIGIYLTMTAAGWFWLFVVAWGFFVIAYDLELFDGRFHNTPSLALSGGSICLGSFYLQSLAVTPQALILTLIISAIAGYGRDLYEVAKPVCKDRSPSAHETSRFAWTLLKSQILFLDILVITMFMRRLLA